MPEDGILRSHRREILKSYIVSIWFKIYTTEGSCEHGEIPAGSQILEKFLSSCATGGFSRKSSVHAIS
jgi:hypothetical protein